AKQGQSVFFRTTDRIFELTDGRIAVHNATSTWQFLGHSEDRLFAQDRENGLLEFRNNRWSPLYPENLLNDAAIADVFSIGEDSVLFATLTNQTYLLHKDKFQRLDIGPWRDLYTPSFSRISDAEYATAT